MLQETPVFFCHSVGGFAADEERATRDVLEALERERRRDQALEVGTPC
jgi:hypothetical protein